MTNPPTPTTVLREALARLPKVPWTKSGATVAIPETEDFAGKALSITGLDKQYARALAAYIAAANPAVIAALLAQLDAHPTGWRDTFEGANEWVLVPAKPTDDMVIAFAEAWFSKVRAIDDVEMEDAYAAMLEAAPAHPADQQEDSGYVCADCSAKLRPGYTCDKCGSDEAIAQQEGDAAGEKDAAEVEAILDDAEEWARYVEVDTAPMTLRKYLDRGIAERAAMQAMKGAGNHG